MLFGLYRTQAERQLETLKEEVDELLEINREDSRGRDRGWATLDSITKSRTDFTPEDREKMQEKAREAFIYSPPAKRIVQYVTAYVMGKDFKVESEDEAVNYIIQQYINDPENDWKTQLKEFATD